MISVRNRLLLLSGNKLLFLLLIVAMGATSCSKKIFSGKKKKDRDKDKEVVDEKDKDKKDEGDKEPIFAPKSTTISLLLPFKLDEINVDNANSLQSFRESGLALDFYQGFKMGLDSLAKKGRKIKLQVFDTEDKSVVVGQIAMKSSLAESDLIVGPIFPSNLATIGNFSMGQQVYYVSPLSPKVVNENNPYQIIATPSLSMHTRKAALFIKNDLNASNVLVVSTGADSESEYIRDFKRNIAESNTGLKIDEVDIGSYGSSVSKLKGYLSESRQNVLLIPSTSATLWKVLFSYFELLPEKYQLNIMAHPNFAEIPQIDLEKAEKYNVYFTSSDTEPAFGTENDFYRHYLSKYNVPPSKYASKGFDLAMFLGNAMVKGKNNIAELIEEHHVGYQSDFEFVKTPNGYVNSGVKVLKVHGYEFEEQK